MTEIPKMHIVKRWTKEARDILPEHLQHYQRDNIGATTLTFRHNQMYVQALELVRLGDASVKAYETLMVLFNQALVLMAPFDMARDGLGLEDCVNSNGQRNGDEVKFSALKIRKTRFLGTTIRLSSWRLPVRRERQGGRRTVETKLRTRG